MDMVMEKENGNSAECGWNARMEAENRRRELLLEREATAHDPLTGKGNGEGWMRVNRAFIHKRVKNPAFRPEMAMEEGVFPQVPVEMAADKDLANVGTRAQWQKLRMRHDFEYWAVTCVRIKDKESARRIPFRLNAGQRKLLAVFEGMRRAGEPIRVIMLKARQWGGSTLTQMYMAWIQCVLVSDWHSLICTHVNRASATIRGMYDAMLSDYPSGLWTDADGEEGNGGNTAARKLLPFQGQSSIKTIPGRRCCITLGSSECQDAIRGGDYALAHLSEVAFWKDSPKSTPGEFVQAIYGAVSRRPLTMIVLESTANGVGNYFHSEWERSVAGKSDKTPLFVAWFEIPVNRRKVTDHKRFWDSMDAYERTLWSEHGCSLEQIAWYRSRRREYASAQQMQAEFPTTPVEAFANTGFNVFEAASVARVRARCEEPQAVGEIASGSGIVVGERSLSALSFRADTTGALRMWCDVVKGASYVVTVDVGGRSASADWSVIAVLRADGDRPEVVAQWRGHTDHDLLTWKAAQIATYYNRALLVFESNTLESERCGDAPEQGAYILHELYDVYRELYWRTPIDGGRPKPGFHTNRATKQMIVTELIGAVRDGTYVERDTMAADELAVYEQLPNGSYGARSGCHDDILMTRAIGLHVVRETAHLRVTLAGDADLRRFLRGR